MQKKLRGLDALEKRVAKLEKQLAETKSTGAQACRTQAGCTQAGCEEAASQRLGGHAHAQGAGRDLEAHGRRARLLAVELDR